MRYPQGMVNGLQSSNGTRDVAQIVCGDRLVEATPEAIRDLAESAMLLSQGARRAIEMMREADDAAAREADDAAAREADSVTTTADAA